MKCFFFFLLTINLFIPVAHAQLFTNQISGSGISSVSPRVREIIDYDNDGFEDLLLFNGKTSSPLKLFKNNHNFTFTDVTASAGLPNNLTNTYAITLDIDNNGYSDLVIIQSEDSIRYFLNNAGSFTEKTSAYGITNPVVRSGGSLHYPIPMDIDRDGDVDILFVRDTVNGSTHAISALINNVSTCGGSFNQFLDKITSIPNSSFTVPALIDFDNDQDGDLVVLMPDDNSAPAMSYHYQPLNLYRNDNGNFTDVTVSSGLTKCNAAGFANAWDYNNDGWLDLLTGTTDYNANGQPLQCRVFKNNGNNTFTDATASIVLRNGPYYYYNGTVIDFDNDGDFDVYWLNHGFSQMPGNQLYVNTNGVFSENATTYGLKLLGGVNGSGANQGINPSWFDADNDGDLDVFASSEVFPNYNSPGFFMKNGLDVSVSRYLDIKLDGCESGKDARGTRVQVQTNGKKLTQYSGARIGGCDPWFAIEASGAMSHRFHFGLGAASGADSVIVYWSSGRITRLANITSNQILTVSEDVNCPVINSQLTVTIAGDTTLCSGQSSFLAATASGSSTGYTFHWSPSAGLSDTLGAIVKASPVFTTTYTVTATSTPGCSGIDTAVITINQGLPASDSISANPDGPICAGTPVSFTSYVINGGNPSFQWKVNGVDIGISSSTYSTDSLQNNDTVVCVMTSSILCVSGSPAASNLLKLTVNPLPSSVLTAADTLICSGDSAQICATAGYTYLWNTASTGSCIETKSAGGYWVTITDVNGCSVVSGHKSISIYPVPSISLVVQGDTLASFGAKAYQWIRNGTLLPGDTSSVYIAHLAGHYSVQVTDSNGCKAVSNAVTIGDVAINDLQTDDLEIYPNPASRSFNIRYAGLADVSFRFSMFNVIGKKVLQEAMNFSGAKTVPVNISHLPPGVYLVQLRSEHSALVRKIMVQ